MATIGKDTDILGDKPSDKTRTANRTVGDSSKILSQLDRMVNDSFANNIYTDTNDYYSKSTSTSLALPSLNDRIPEQGNIQNNYYDNRDGRRYNSNEQRNSGPPTPTPEKDNIKNNLYNSNQNLNPFTPGGTFGIEGMPQAGRYFDPYVATHWLRNISTELGISTIPGRERNVSKGIEWAASQLLLTSLNPTDFAVGGIPNAIWNPLSLAASVVPLVRSQPLGVSPILAPAIGHDYKTVVEIEEAIGESRLLQMRKGRYVESPNANLLFEFRDPRKGFIGDVAKRGDLDTLDSPGLLTPVSIEGQVDQEGVMAGTAKALLIHRNIYTPSNTYEDRQVFSLEEQLKQTRELEKQPGISANEAVKQSSKISALFDQRGFMDGEWFAKARPPKFSRESTEIGEEGTNKFLSQDLSVAFPQERDGVIEGEAIKDSDIYMPFMFQDLRIEPAEFLYFRAFIRNGFSETFTPDWTLNRYYGRVDQVPIYKGTMRNISLGFDVVAWSPRDLPVMYKKLHKLQSMVYPAFDVKGFLERSPIIRVRVGDLISSGKLGIPGYINSLDFSYDDTVWSTEEGFRGPMKVGVTLGFTVLHEGNPGSYKIDDKYIFGAMQQSDVEGEEIPEVPFEYRVRGIIQKVNSYYAENNLF